MQGWGGDELSWVVTVLISCIGGFLGGFLEKEVGGMGYGEERREGREETW